MKLSFFVLKNRDGIYADAAIRRNLSFGNFFFEICNALFVVPHIKFTIRLLHYPIRNFKRRVSSSMMELRAGLRLTPDRLTWYYPRRARQNFTLRACSSEVSSDDDKRVTSDEFSKMKIDTLSSDSENPVSRLQEMIGSLPPVILVMRRHTGTNFAIGLCIATTFLLIVATVYVARRSRYSRPGSVADLVRRGQLRSDRRGISRPLKYDDPFNNPLVKVGKSNSTVEMCGKVYRLAPVTLTEEQQAKHQKRRSRAYQWKRPTVFLKEGDSIPPDVDPDTVRWIPANHPFATTASEIDENLAQNNVYQKYGVPYRIQAEHEALQKKLEALQNEQKLNNLLIDPSNAKNFEGALKSHPKSSDQIEQASSINQVGNFESDQLDHPPKSFRSDSASEEIQKP